MRNDSLYTQRLDKLLSQGAGISRKQAGNVIREGRVCLNGEQVTAPDLHCLPGCALELDGCLLELVGSRCYMLNKPQGVLCATRDNKAPTVLELLPRQLRRGLFPAGRLDKDTTGLVLLTDDGDLAHRLLSPKRKVGKTYHALLDAPMDFEAVAEVFSRPMDLGDGDVTSPARLRLLEEGPHPLAELIIYEGRYHQVKRMFADQGLGVLALSRVAIGGLCLDKSLAPGEYRALSQREIELLLSRCGG